MIPMPPPPKNKMRRTQSRCVFKPWRDFPRGKGKGNVELAKATTLSSSRENTNGQVARGKHYLYRVHSLLGYTCMVNNGGQVAEQER